MRVASYAPPHDHCRKSWPCPDVRNGYIRHRCSCGFYWFRKSRRKKRRSSDAIEKAYSGAWKAADTRKRRKIAEAIYTAFWHGPWTKKRIEELLKEHGI
jgi:hypothetical protein